MANGKIKARKPPPTEHGIKVTSLPALEDDIVRFSFKHLDLTHEKFCCNGKDRQYFAKLLQRLKDLSAWKANEVHAERSSALRSHPIHWDRTSEPNGFRRLNDQLRDLPAFQFEISSNAHGRVHGFFIDNVFFVIWLDPDHLLYLQ